MLTVTSNVVEYTYQFRDNVDCLSGRSVHVMKSKYLDKCDEWCFNNKETCGGYIREGWDMCIFKDHSCRDNHRSGLEVFLLTGDLFIIESIELYLNYPLLALVEITRI